MKAVVLYQSKTGTTKKYAEEIQNYLSEKGIETLLVPIKNFKKEQFDGNNYLFLGCWTSGLFFFLQHPDKQWIKFSKKLPENTNVKIGFFTTYKILTGSMFRNMKKNLKGVGNITNLHLKSKDGKISDLDKIAIDEFLN